MAVALTRGVTGGGSSSTAVSSVNASTAVNADSIDVSIAQSAKWLVTIYDATNTLVVGFEVFAIHRNGANPTHTVSNIIGDTSIAYAVDVVINTTLLTLQITNNDTVTLTVSVTRTITIM